MVINPVVFGENGKVGDIFSKNLENRVVHLVGEITDEMAASMLTEVSGCHDPAAFQALPAQTQQCLTRQLLGKGVSLHQASRVTGLSLWTVRKCR